MKAQNHEGFDERDEQRRDDRAREAVERPAKAALSEPETEGGSARKWAGPAVIAGIAIVILLAVVAL